MSPQSPYAATKAAADHLALSFYRSFESPVAVVRPFNTYGPRQSARAVIPSIIIQVLSGKKRIKLGSVFPSRDLSYIKDTVSGIMAVSESDESIGRVINLGMNLAVSIKELARLIANIMKVDIEIETEEKRVRPEKSEVTTLIADAEKARNLLGWSPKYSLEEGLRNTIEWFKNNLILYKSDIYNV